MIYENYKKDAKKGKDLMSTIGGHFGNPFKHAEKRKREDEFPRRKRRKSNLLSTTKNWLSQCGHRKALQSSHKKT